MEFDAFRKLYIKQHRNSVPNRGTQGWIRLAAIALFLSSAAVSGAHTIPTIAETLPFAENLLLAKIIISIVSLFMVEIALFAIAFVRRMDLLHSKVFLTIMQSIALAVAIAGNLYSTFNALGLDIANPNWFTLVVGGAIGLGAPLLTMLSGDILAAVEMKHQESWKDFDAKVLTAFTKAQKADRRTDGQVSNVDSIGRTGYGYSFNRTADAKDKVLEYLQDNEGASEMSVRDLASIIGVGKSTVSNAKREFAMSQNGHSLNGHGE